MRESRRLDSVRPTVQPRFPKPSAVKLNESLTFTKLYRGKAQTGIFQEPGQARKRCRLGNNSHLGSRAGREERGRGRGEEKGERGRRGGGRCVLLRFANSPPKTTSQSICEADKGLHASCDAHHSAHGTDPQAARFVCNPIAHFELQTM